MKLYPVDYSNLTCDETEPGHRTHTLYSVTYTNPYYTGDPEDGEPINVDGGNPGCQLAATLAQLTGDGATILAVTRSGTWTA